MSFINGVEVEKILSLNTRWHTVPIRSAESWPSIEPLYFTQGPSTTTAELLLTRLPIAEDLLMPLVYKGREIGVLIAFERDSKRVKAALCVDPTILMGEVTEYEMV